jgi:hypothetical protein
MTLNLQALAPSPFICPNVKIPAFIYGTSVHARKLLQLAARAAFFLGVTLASTITASLTAPLYVAIEDFKKVTVKQIQTIHALSDGLTILNYIVQNMHLEMLAIEKCIGKIEQHNLETFQKMYTETLKNAQAIQCLHTAQTLDTAMNDLHTLFITGQGWETRTLKTIMDNRYHSECSSGICIIYLLQIFLNNAKTAHFTTTIPRKLGDIYVTSHTQLLYISDTKAFYYPQDRMIPITQGLYVLTEPLKHELNECFMMNELIPTRLADTVQALGHNNFVVCSADNMTVEVFFKNWNFSNWGLIGFDSSKRRLNDGCYLIRGLYKLNVTFTHTLNRYFNTISYSRQVWDKIHYEVRHYFSVSEHITPDIISRDLLAPEQAEEQLNTLIDTSKKMHKSSSLCIHRSRSNLNTGTPNWTLNIK